MNLQDGENSKINKEFQKSVEVKIEPSALNGF